MNDEALYGIAAHWHYKTKGSEDIKQPKWVEEILNIQRESEDTSDFISKMKFDIFQNRIFVFSPSGDVFELPEKSTPVDFAYAVHTEIGNKTTGALVNNSMTTLSHELKNGDLVEIIIEKNKKGPSKDWLKFVKTSRAKQKIKQHTKKYSFDQFRKFIPKI
jgi:GTP pyrophosphokinase